jgi:hypothetical protein
MNNGSTPARALHEKLEGFVRADAHLMQLLEVGLKLDLPHWRLVAGCIYQTVWNGLTGRPPRTGINDYDFMYFEATDLSADSEGAMQARIRSQLPGFPAPVEVCNQARVHLWFEDHFGIPYPALSSADVAIVRYASMTHAVGVRLTQEGRLDVFAPYGLDDIFAMIVRPNPLLANKATHERKAARAKVLWPELTVIPWD